MCLICKWMAVSCLNIPCSPKEGFNSWPHQVLCDAAVISSSFMSPFLLHPVLLLYLSLLLLLQCVWRRWRTWTLGTYFFLIARATTLFSACINSYSFFKNLQGHQLCLEPPPPVGQVPYKHCPSSSHIWRNCFIFKKTLFYLTCVLAASVLVPLEARKGCRIPWTWVRELCELPSRSAGHWSQVLWKGSERWELLSLFSCPCLNLRNHWFHGQGPQLINTPCYCYALARHAGNSGEQWSSNCAFRISLCSQILRT